MCFVHVHVCVLCNVDLCVHVNETDSATVHTVFGIRLRHRAHNISLLHQYLLVGHCCDHLGCVFVPVCL